MGSRAAFSNSRSRAAFFICGSPYETLQGAEGDAFDTSYIQAQTTAHETAVTLYQTYAQGGDNQTLVAYAQKSLPALQQHLEHAQGMAKN